MAFYELRQYKVKPGKLAEWVKIMEEEIIPFQVSKGMVICGSFAGEEDESVYVWLRRFESEEQRKELYAAVYEKKKLLLGVVINLLHIVALVKHIDKLIKRLFIFFV